MVDYFGDYRHFLERVQPFRAYGTAVTANLWTMVNSGGICHE